MGYDHVSSSIVQFLHFPILCLSYDWNHCWYIYSLANSEVCLSLCFWGMEVIMFLLLELEAGSPPFPDDFVCDSHLNQYIEDYSIWA